MFSQFTWYRKLIFHNCEFVWDVDFWLVWAIFSLPKAKLAVE